MRLWLKLVLVLGMTLAILVPLTMVRGVVHERQEYRRQAVADIARSYAGQQLFAGPVLVVPYRQVIEVEEPDATGVVRTTRRVQENQWTFFPTVLTVDGDLKPGIRQRGLHEVRVYEWHASAEASFEVVIPADPGPEQARRIGQPYLGYAIGDVRGLVGTPVLKVDGRRLALEQGQGARRGEGLHVRLDAPVSGGKHPAEHGQLTIFASGPEEARPRVAPFFDALGQRTIWVGGAGPGRD